MLLQNATAMLLQNVMKIYYKMRKVFDYKMQQFYYKLKQLLENASCIMKSVGTFVKELF